MFRAETWLSVLWLACCYSILAAAMIVAQQASMPVQRDPVAGFQMQKGQFAAELTSEPLSQWSLITLPVRLDAIPESPQTFQVHVDPALPRSIEFVSSNPSLVFAAGSDQAAVKLKVNWRQIAEPTQFTLLIDGNPILSELPASRCDVQLFPLPMIACRLESPEFHEGLENELGVVVSMTHPFNQPVPLSIELQCDSELQQCIPQRKQSVKLLPGELEKRIVFKIPDNSIATGDRSMQLNAEKFCSRISLSGSRLRMTYKDDERVYFVTIEPSKSKILDEENAAATRQTITATLHQPCGQAGLTIPIDLRGSAQSGKDYMVDPMFVFKPGQRRAMVHVQALEDDLFEGTETIQMVFHETDILRFPQAPTINLNLIENDPLTVTATMTPSPARLIEGKTEKPILLDFTCLPGQAIERLSEADRTIKVSFEPEGDQAAQSAGLEVVSTGERPIRNNTFLLNNQGTATVKLFVRDDDIFQGLTMGSLKVKAGDKLRVVAPKPLSILIDDNEPLPAILSLHGTMIPDPQDINNRELVTLTEADVSITATLRIKLEEPAARDLMIGLHLGGTASKQDSRLGPSEFLLAETTEDFETRTLRIPKGTQEIVVPVSALDDDAFEGSEYQTFDLIPSLGGTAPRLRIVDDDPVRVTFAANPLIVRKGEQAFIRVRFSNASNGITHPLPVQLSILGSSSEAAKHFVLKQTLVEIPPRSLHIDIPVNAVDDKRLEGRKRFQIAMTLPKHRDSHYKCDEQLNLWIDDPNDKAQTVVVLIVTPHVQQQFGTFGAELAGKIQQSQSRLEGGGIVMLGEAGKTALWKGDSLKLPVEPITSTLAEGILKQAVAAIESTLPAGSPSAEAVLFWDSPPDPVSVQELAAAFPTSDRIRLSILLYNTSKQRSFFMSAAKSADRGSKQHRVGERPEPLGLNIVTHFSDFLTKYAQ